MNIQGLASQTVQSKVPFLQDLIKTEDQLFFGLSETWLKDHKEAEIAIDDYMIFRTNSPRIKKARGRLSGGGAMYVRDDIACSTEIVFSYETDPVQMICLYSQPENFNLPHMSWPGGGCKPGAFNEE